MFSRSRAIHTARMAVVANEMFDDEQPSSVCRASDPEALLLHTDDVTLIERAMCNLSTRFHELLMLRELGELSYQEVANVMGVLIGTVMSGLSRAGQAPRRARSRAETMHRHGINDRRGEYMVRASAIHAAQSSRFENDWKVQRWSRRQR